MRIVNTFLLYVQHPKKIIAGVVFRLNFLFPDKMYLKIIFWTQMNYKLDLYHPKTFNEKLQWLKIYNRKSEYTSMVDKYAVKEYVAKIIGEEYIIPTFGVWDSPDEIDFGKLPRKFVLKTTNGGGSDGVIVCTDKSKLDLSSVRKKMKKALKLNIYSLYREWPYKNVKHRIIAEYLLEVDGDTNIDDYKLFCFNGTVKLFKIDFDRHTMHKANYYDPKLNLLDLQEDVCPPDYNRPIKMPTNINKMIELAEVLSKDVPFVRIDFYNINGKIYFGEITFFPAGGLGTFTPREWDIKLGEYIKL